MLRALDINVLESVLSCWFCMVKPLTLGSCHYFKIFNLTLTDLGLTINIKIPSDTDGVPSTYEVFPSAKKEGPILNQGLCFAVLRIEL